MVGEIKIINDSTTCFSQQGVQKGVDECRFICPRKMLEKSLKFVLSEVVRTMENKIL